MYIERAYSIGILNSKIFFSTLFSLMRPCYLVTLIWRSLSVVILDLVSRMIRRMENPTSSIFHLGMSCSNSTPG